MFRSNDVAVRRAGPDKWALEEKLVYDGKHDTFVVPAGFETDFASVPRIFTWMIPKYGKYTLAAILHDWFCDVEIKAGAITSRDADGVFRRVMRELGVPVLQRWIMWAGVRVGAMFNPVRRPGVLQDLPMVLLILLATLPFTLIPVIGILLALAVYLPLEKVFGL